MATLYVENVPDELYAALRKRAKGRRRSIAAEIIDLLERNIPTDRELRRRRAATRSLDLLRGSAKRQSGNFPSAEEMIREDRDR